MGIWREHSLQLNVYLQFSQIVKRLTSNPAHTPPSIAGEKKPPAMPTPHLPIHFMAGYLIRHLEKLTFYCCE
jgi:hypothetical protein